ncbi:MAG: 30S ribosomal protein S6 [Acidobacteriota bacterium]|jgi:small subunit ribosomal protein S6|nr:30S ribosomal protein S6 [Acidobacteriota bacterium]
MQRSYEIGFIVNPDATEEEVKKVNELVVSLVEKNAGKVEKLDEWGRRPLAYPIQDHQEGIYTFAHVTMGGGSIAELEKRIKLNEKVMRYIVVRLDERLRKSNRLVKKWKRHDERRSREPNGGQENDYQEQDSRGRYQEEDGDDE